MTFFTYTEAKNQRQAKNVHFKRVKFWKRGIFLWHFKIRLFHFVLGFLRVLLFWKFACKISPVLKAKCMSVAIFSSAVIRKHPMLVRRCSSGLTSSSWSWEEDVEARMSSTKQLWVCQTAALSSSYLKREVSDEQKRYFWSCF